MAQYIARRLLMVIPTLIAISLITFIIMHATPGSPMQPSAPQANPLPPAAQEALAKKYGLDKPLWQQYLHYLRNIFTLDFGFSYQYQTREVREIMATTLPVSLHLGVMAMALAILIGIPLGVIAAINQNGPVDYLCSFIATLGVAVPNFILALFLIVLLVLLIPIIPRTGGWDSPIDWVLPTLALSLGPIGIIARYTRASMVEVLRQDFIRTAYAKGLSDRQVIVRHVLKNGLIPPITILGPMFAAIGTGSPFVEKIFRVPGMGRFFVDSLIARDYPMIMAVILIYGAFLAIMNIVVDILYGVVDPRIRLA
ncbi:ABC transporter permease [Thermomicrobium roseum]|jgi:ABC-type dipeptide/oligopeptide/nickel transport system permease component|uniref:Dipeptide transport system permease protein DppB n=1 Tax=Thermomicrobium roseum (strain ATCC 27502 / DSM 5159 / P-2) TaxID=309801 RepID=B9L3G1_THERP|nr:ABC transporter permease [Thermomicrobium roseum]ACM06688.1 dipeptide transport system permease protein DppB [Thermomicrobium roseum DSM 5159]